MDQINDEPVISAIITVKPLTELENMDKRRSKVWEHFGKKFCNGVQVDQLIYCILCHRAEKHCQGYSIKSSTGTLSTHLKSEHDLNVTFSESALVQRTSNIFATNATPATPKEALTTFARRAVLWLAEDLLPFNTVAKIGFKKFMIRMGFVNDVSQIPSNNAVSQTALEDCYLLTKNAFNEKVQEAPKVINVVTDLWTSIGKQSFITITVRFMTNDLNLENLTLSTEAIDHPHTGENISKIIEDNLNEAGLGDKIVSVAADNARNINRLGPHKVNNILQPALLKNCKVVILF
jgi:hypothetical protein